MSETSADSTSTRHLLKRVRAGAPAAFDLLFDRHRKYLRQVIGMRLDARIRRRVDASDVIQETQIEATQRLPEYLKQESVPFRVWLRRMAHQQLCRLREQHVAAAKRTVRREVPLPYESSLHLARRFLSSEHTPSKDMDDRELARRVREAIAQLDELDREIVLMLDMEGLSSRQVGFVLDLNPVTVRRRHGSALLQLLRILREGGLTESQL